MKESDLAGLTLADLSSQIRRKKVSPVEVAELFLERIGRLNPRLNAYQTLTQEKALAQAKRAASEIRRGRYRGPLHGIPFSIKDNLATQGIRTTAGSKILAEWVPDFDATAVARLKEAGAVILGKTNMHEWAGGGTTINPYYGATRNPWDPERIPGGSSGGSAAAVAAGLCLGSLGTDNAGSVRNPAALCGVVGLKATHGRVSRFGGVPGTGGFSTDHFGILAKTVRDSALILEAIAGYDPKEPLSSEEPVPRYARRIGQGVKGLKVGIIQGYFEGVVVGEVQRAFDEAVGLLRSLGMKPVEIAIPHVDLIPAVQTATSRAENVASHERFLRTRPRDFSPALLYRHIAALTIPASTYVTAQKVRRLICREFDEALQKVQVIVAPTVAFAAPTIAEIEKGFMEAGGRRVGFYDERGSISTRCTIPFNVTGLPALSLCCGFSSSGLPIGMQVVSGPFQEETVFQVAHAYERAAGWRERRPSLD